MATKKVFDKMAALFREAWAEADKRPNNLDGPTVAWMMDKIADGFQRENPSFNRERFIAACMKDRS